MDIIRVAIADDHALICKIIAEQLNRSEMINVVLYAGNGSELIEKMQEMHALPDIVLMDIEMPVMNGEAATISLKRQWPEVKVLVLSDSFSLSHLGRMIRAGANGYVSKSSSTEDLSDILIYLNQHDYYYNGLYNRKLEKKIMDDSYDRDRLNELEVEILKGMVRGHTYREIAEELRRTIKCIEGIRSKLYEKTSSKHKVDLLLYGLQHGYFSLKDL